MAASDVEDGVVNHQSTGEISPVDVHRNQYSSVDSRKGQSNISATDIASSPSLQTLGLHARRSSEEQSSQTGVDSNGYPDSASVQGSLPDGDSARDTGSVVDGIGLDTDAGRTEGADSAKDGINHKSGLAKKPTTFKAVSVTRSFLAKTATIVPALKTSGEKSELTISCTSFEITTNGICNRCGPISQFSFDISPKTCRKIW